MDVASKEDLEIHKMDAVAAFIHSVPKETMFFRIPEGYHVENCTEHTGLKVNKSIYRIKHFPRWWYKKLCSFCKAINLKSLDTDTCVSFIHSSLHWSYVNVHVDNTKISGTETSIQSFKDLISKKFEMNDLGEVTKILGMSISQYCTAQKIKLSQAI